VRELTLPAGSREDGVSASYQNGLLEVNVPLDGEVKPDFIRVPIVAG
jgi:HSP20 family molecular chaperone IbpA